MRLAVLVRDKSKKVVDESGRLSATFTDKHFLVSHSSNSIVTSSTPMRTKVAIIIV